MDERTRVHKLWFGLRKEIQKELWRERLNPEISSLREVIAAAEIIEIAQSVTVESHARGRSRMTNTIQSAPDADLPEFWDESVSEGSDDFKDSGATADPSESLSCT